MWLGFQITIVALLLALAHSQIPSSYTCLTSFAGLWDNAFLFFFGSHSGNRPHAWTIGSDQPVGLVATVI